MTLFKLTKKQVIVRVILLIVLLIAAYIVLCIRACPKWEPAEVTPQFQQTRENPYIDPTGNTQATRILPPEGYTRTEAAADSFLAFMREQPVYGDGSMIYVYDGSVRSGAGAAAVYTMSVVEDQQCADSIIRLWSEYFRVTGQTERLAFHYSNGTLCDYESWKRGKRMLAFGEWAHWVQLKGRSDSDKTFYSWLASVMHYAGTLSLEAESVPIAPEEAHTGDILCHGGAPGHAVLIVDEAENADGERVFLLAQGFIPAQSCQILAGYGGADSPWYTEAQLAGDTISLEGYTFRGEGILRRWNDGF